MERVELQGEEKAEGEKHTAGVEACMVEALHLVGTGTHRLLFRGQAITMIKTLMMASSSLPNPPLNCTVPHSRNNLVSVE